MNKIILIGLCVVLIVLVGCTNYNIESHPCRDVRYRVDEGKCPVIFTILYFENKSGYLFEDSKFHLKTWHNDVYFESYYGNKIMICENESYRTAECVDKIYEFIVPCSYCVRVQSNGKLTDFGDWCLDEVCKYWPQIPKNR